MNSGSTPPPGETYVYPDGKILIATTYKHNLLLDKPVEYLRTEIATVNNDPQL